MIMGWGSWSNFKENIWKFIVVGIDKKYQIEWREIAKFMVIQTQKKYFILVS